MDQSAEGQGCQGKLKNAIDYALFVADGFQAFYCRGEGSSPCCSHPLSNMPFTNQQITTSSWQTLPKKLSEVSHCEAQSKSSTRLTTQVKGVTRAKVEASKSPFSERSLQRTQPTILRNSSLMVEIQDTISKSISRQDLQDWPLLSSPLLYLL
jgi:hypothetical protein